MRPRITLVVAADEEGGIGRGGGLPWHLPGDLRFFREVTGRRPLVMGRRTHESIGRRLPDRANIVVTRSPGYRPAEGCEVAHDLEEALEMAARHDPEEVMVIGGAEIFRLVLPLAGRIYLTRVHARTGADTFLPELDPSEWREVWRRERAADADNPYACSFILLERKGQCPNPTSSFRDT